MTDLRFHMTMASLSKTHIQVALLEDLFDRLLLKYSKDLFYVSMIGTSQNEHYAIMDAFKQKNLNQMTDALTYHLKQTQGHIIKGLTQSLNERNQKATKYHSFKDIKDSTIS